MNIPKLFLKTVKEEWEWRIMAQVVEDAAIVQRGVL